MKSWIAILFATVCLVGTVAAKERKPAIGAKISAFTFKDIRYLSRNLDDLGPHQACVLVFTTTTCPLAQRYLPRLKELYAAYQPREVQFLAVNVGPEDSIQDTALQALEYGIEFPFVKDFDGQCARALGVDRTPQVVVLDGEHRLRYRGRIDNQYRLGGVKPSVDRHDLQEAIDDVLARRPVTKAETPVDGCAITFSERSRPAKGLTYARDVAPLIHKHCVECHRPGTEAPFALLTYEQVAAKAATIAEVVTEQRMPPSFAHPDFGQFLYQRGLTEAERDTILQWVRAGKKRGDLATAPKPPDFPQTKWRIGEPDLVITAAKAEALPATGYIPYRYVVLPYVFKQDTWVQGIEIMPSNPRVVHHANLGYVSLASGFDVDQNFLTGKVPGGVPMDLDSGIAILIPKGHSLAFQIHYVTTGKEETDQISVGLRYAKEPIRKRMRYKIIADYKFQIPPGAPAHPVAATKALECDATGIGLFSHMHLRGKDTTFVAHYPNGKSERLLVLPNYSFDWQLSYRWPEGHQRLPKGTRLECSSHFDNSPFNPYNPDPKATVRNGPQTHDEMMQGFFFYTDDAEHLDLRVDPKTGVEITREETRAGD